MLEFLNTDRDLSTFFESHGVPEWLPNSVRVDPDSRMLHAALVEYGGSSISATTYIRVVSALVLMVKKANKYTAAGELLRFRAGLSERLDSY